MVISNQIKQSPEESLQIITIDFYYIFEELCSVKNYNSTRNYNKDLCICGSVHRTIYLDTVKSTNSINPCHQQFHIFIVSLR